MKICVDTHTHTYASGHAYSTLLENVALAKQHGLEMFCTTDHASSMPGAPHYWFFNNQRVLPREIDGVTVIKGVEANILNAQGELDIHPTTFDYLEWVIASFHEAVFKPADKTTHTEALFKVIESGQADALGHLGNPNYDFDFVAVIQAAAQHNVAIELNNSSLKGNSRVGSTERCYQIAQAAKQYGALITTGSDAHFCYDVGNLTFVTELIGKVGFAPEQVITASRQQFLQFLALRGKSLS